MINSTARTFEHHRAFKRLFAPGKLTLGLFLPLDFYTGDLGIFHQHTEHIKQIDLKNFAAVWVRDIPLFDPGFGDAGQVYDAFTYLSYLAGQTNNVALGTGSIILPFWHPVALAKTAASLDQLSDNRLILGVGSGDRMAEFPAFNVTFEQRGERFRQVLEEFRILHTTAFPEITSSLTQIRGVDLLPKSVTSHIPALITGASQQALSWVAEHGDGWITYPGATTKKKEVLVLGEKIKAWRKWIPNGVFKPHMTNEWIELAEDPHFPRTALRGGFILKTGRLGLIDLLHEWQEIGVNHVAIGIQFGNRPIGEMIDELAEEVLPHFPALVG